VILWRGQWSFSDFMTGTIKFWWFYDRDNKVFREFFFFIFSHKNHMVLMTKILWSRYIKKYDKKTHFFMTGTINIYFSNQNQMRIQFLIFLWIEPTLNQMIIQTNTVIIKINMVIIQIKPNPNQMIFFYLIESNANWALFGESNQLWIKYESILFLRIESIPNQMSIDFSNQNQMRIQFLIFLCF